MQTQKHLINNLKLKNMKKALVLGVLAIFAISISNVNAQDRTNVQQKSTKTYLQESEKGKVAKETTSINQGVKVQDPASKQVNTQKKKVVNQKQALPKNKAKNEVGKAANGEKTVGNEVQEVKFNSAASQKKAEKAPSTAVKNESKKVAPINNSVPPTNKTKAAAGTPKTTSTTK